MGCGDGKKSIRVSIESCHWSIFCTIFCSFTLGLMMLFWSLPEFRPLGKQLYQPLLKGRKSPIPLIHTQENGYSLCFQGQAGSPALLGTGWEGQKDRSLSSVPSHTHHSAELAGWREGNNTPLRQGVTATALNLGSHMLREVGASLLHHGSKKHLQSRALQQRRIQS